MYVPLEYLFNILDEMLTADVDIRSAGVWDDYNVVDGRIVTGQNPQSATSTAKAVLEVFEKL